MAKPTTIHTREAELIALTREESALQSRVRRLRRQLQIAVSDLKLTRRERKALQGVMEQERTPLVMPSRLTNGATGYRVPEQAPEPTRVDAAAEAFVEAVNDGKGEKPA